MNALSSTFASIAEMHMIPADKILALQKDCQLGCDARQVFPRGALSRVAPIYSRLTSRL